MGTKHSYNIYALADTPKRTIADAAFHAFDADNYLYILKYSNRKCFDKSFNKFHNWNQE